MEGTRRAPITLFPLQIITKKKKILVALGMVFSLGLQEGNLFKSFTDVMYAIAIYHLSKMQWIDL